MRFRLANSIYVYGIDKKEHFDNQTTWVGSFGAEKTYLGHNTIPIRNYGIEPRDFNYEEYDPLHPWYQVMILRVLMTFPEKERNVKYGYSWDILNYHAHTIQLAIKRFINKKRSQYVLPLGLYRQRSYWDIDDLYTCIALLNKPLRYENEELYYKCLEQKYDWVDSILEARALEEQSKFLVEEERETFC